MDKAIFQFCASEYEQKQVESLTREQCETLCNTDEDNVVKFPIDGNELQTILNDGTLDVDGSFYRVFID